MASTGTAVVDFGTTPASEASIAVTGQAGILATSLVEAWVMGETTAENDEQAHLNAGIAMKVTCGIPSAGTGFTIYCENLMGLATGTFKIKWVWS